MKRDPQHSTDGGDALRYADIPEVVHLVGIGGAGQSGLAQLLHERGHRVSGSDRARSPFTDLLEGRGVPIALGEVGAEGSALSEPEVELLVRSAAVPLEHPLCAAAQARGIPVEKYGQLLARVAPRGRTLAACGTHGKTTTSWMLHHALRGIAELAGKGAPAPGALVGGIDRALGVNACAPDPGGWFAVEACEYDRTFLNLKPAGAAVTNVEADHLDYYGTVEAIEAAFARFLDGVSPDGLIVAGPEVPERVFAAARAPVWRLGRELELVLCGGERGHFRFRVFGPGWGTPEITLGVPGSFNAENAALALGLAVGLAAREWHLDPREAAKAAAEGLERFVGVQRRFETWGERGGVTVVHDYAHHPTEVRVTLEAARRAYPGKALHVLFQPHQRSRTARFLDEFVESLRGVDRCVIADVYGARVHIDDRAAGAPEMATRLVRAGVDARAPGGLSESVDEVLAEAPEDCALLVLGAGDVETVRDDLLDKLAVRSLRPRGSLR